MLKRIASLFWVSLLCALGACGGGSNPGTNLFNTSGASAPSSTAASIDVLTSATQIGSASASSATITAIVKDSGNNSLPSVPVTFSVDSGTLTSAATTTSSSGVATAVLSAGSNFSNRKMTVTVVSGSAVGKVAVQVAGTTLTYSGATTVPLAGAVTVGVKATDSAGNPISALTVTPSSSLNNGLSATSLTTDTTGTATLTYTATNAGTDSLTFSGGGTSVVATVLISPANFTITTPAANAQIPVGTSQPVTVQYLSNGAPQVGQLVNFTATAGSVSPSSATTNASGVATVNVMSSTAGPATLQATLASGGAQATAQVSFVSLTPASITLQVNPAAISPNTAGSTTQRATLVATVVDVNGNPVSGATVDFTRIVDPSHGNLSAASALTDSSGQATVQYYAGADSTANDGVQFEANVPGTTVASSTTNPTSLTVDQSALFIALGTGNTIQVLDAQTYRQDWVVYVTDANGVAVPNIVLTMSAVPQGYLKGDLAWNVAASEWTYGTGFPYQCPVQTVNGTILPGNVISVSTSLAGSTSTSPNTVTTGPDGTATISLIYAKSYAFWVYTQLEAQAVVAGTQSSNIVKFVVTGAAADYDTETVAPPGQTSPFGVHNCATPN